MCPRIHVVGVTTGQPMRLAQVAHQFHDITIRAVSSGNELKACGQWYRYSVPLLTALIALVLIILIGAGATSKTDDLVRGYWSRVLNSTRPGPGWTIKGITQENSDRDPGTELTKGRTMKNTPIQWCHLAINPVMGCDGCDILTII
jgi:hypothetical protein